ncbi:hypothetical protein BLX87_07440 [Bacillus sp. VT-16-64]|nr:hypothetical protein BLX87_07440 [Bacillus sp. VT-16-64]
MDAVSLDHHGIKLLFMENPGMPTRPPMDRFNALVAAGKFIDELRQLPKQVSSSAVATIGIISVEPYGTM